MRFRLLPYVATSCLALLCPLVRADDALLPDERLQQKISISASSKTLEEVAKDLTQKTGVVIRVGSGERDWKVRERKVHLELHNLPLGAALSQIAKTTGYELRRMGDSGQWLYRIWQSNRGREYEATMLTSQTEEKEKETADIRAAVLKDAESAEALSPQDAMNLREKDPWRAYLGGTDAGRAYSSLLRGMPPEAKELMLRGRKVTLNADDLSPEMRKNLDKMVAGSFFVKGPVGNNGAEGKELADAISKTTPSRLVFMPLPEQMKRGMEGNLGMAGLAVILGDPKDPSKEVSQMMDQSTQMGINGMPMAVMPLTGSDRMGSIFGDMMLRLEAGEDPQSVGKHFDQQMRTVSQQPQQSAPPESKDSANAPTSPASVDPALQAMIEPIRIQPSFDMQSQSQMKTLVAELARQTSLSFTDETYLNDPNVDNYLPKVKAPLYKVLDSIRPAGYTWVYEGGVVRLRPKNWALYRSYDVPESLLAGYRQILDTKGWLDLDLVGKLCATLTDSQIDYRVLQDPELSQALQMPLSMGSRDLLRLYGSLTDDQKVKLKSPAGLTFDGLDQNQWDQLSRTIEDEMAGKEVKTGKIMLAIMDDKPKIAKNVPSSQTTEPAAAPTGAGNVPNSVNKGPMFLKERFIVEIGGEENKTPVRMVRTVSIPTQAQVRQMKQWREDAKKIQAEENNKENPKRVEEKKPAEDQKPTPTSAVPPPGEKKAK